MNQPSHPIWAIVRLMVLMLTLTVVLYLTATKFDASELKVIMYMFIAAASGETAIGLLKSIFNRGDR